MATAAEADGPHLTVAAVARRLGVAPATLRTWDRRYGLGPSEHAGGTHRRYSTHDVDRLLHMNRLLHQGVRPAEAARIVRAAIDPAPAPAAAPAATPAVTQRAGHGGRVLAMRGATAAQRGLARAAMELDGLTVGGLVVEAVSRYGAALAWTALLAPVLIATGRQWEAGRVGVEVEHLLSDSILAALHGARLRAPAPAQAVRPALLASAPDEWHSLPVHAMGAALAEAGVPVRVLGAATPAESLAAAAARVNPSCVLVWSALTVTGRPEIFADLPVQRPPLTALAAGPGWGDDVPAEVRRVHSLGEALAAVAVATGASPAPG